MPSGRPLRARCVLLGVAAVLVAFVATAAGASKASIALEDSANLSASAGQRSDRPRIAITGDGTLHVVWQEQDPNGAYDNVVHRYRPPGGEWSPPAALTIFRNGYDPAIATDGGTVAVAFQRGNSARGDRTSIYYALWSPVDRAWSRARPIEDGEANIGADGQQPDLAFGTDGVLWLTWIDTTYGYKQPTYARIQGGVATGKAISEPSLNAQSPTIALDPEDNVHVAWTEQSDLRDEAYIAHWVRPATGGDWYSDGTLHFLAARKARWPDIAATEGNLCLVWHEETTADNNEIVLECNDRRWNASNSEARSLVPSLALDDRQGPLVAWQERGAGTSPTRILFRQGPPPPPVGEPVTDGPVDMPSVAYRGGYVHAAWSERRGTLTDVLYARWAVAAPPPTPTATASRTPTVTPTATATPRFSPTPTATRPTPEALIYAPYASRIKP